MKNSIMIGALILLTLGVVAFFVFDEGNTDENIISSDGFTTVKLSSNSMGQYNPKIIRVEQGARVRI
ncbi:MAG TPA: hypothetical protein V6C58_00850, partial [Allocoleopsis sp.]